MSPSDITKWNTATGGGGHGNANDAAKHVERMRLRQQEQMLMVLQEEQAAEEERQRLLAAAVMPESRKRLTRDFDIARKKAQERVERLRHDFEQVLAARLSSFGLIR